MATGIWMDRVICFAGAPLLDDTKKIMAAFSLWELGASYLRITNTTFGGGDPTMLALRKELVDQRKVLSTEEFGLAFLLARVTPGTNMLAFCAGTGFQLRGWAGALLAVAGASIPASVAGVVLVRFFELWMGTQAGAAALGGLSAAAIGLMFAGALLLAMPQFRSGGWLRSAAIFLVALGLSWGAGWQPLTVMAAIAVLGAFWKEPGEN